MKIVVDINDAFYNRLFNNVVDTYDRLRICDAVKNGIQLPKGHGRLVDADRLEQIQNDRLQDGEIKIWELKLIVSALDAAETVIEADGGDTE